MKKNEILTLSITDIAYGGKGIARNKDGKVIFVPHTLPGEIVSISIKRHFNDYAEGEIIKILKPSPERRESNCMVYAGTDVMGKDRMMYRVICTWFKNFCFECISYL